MTRNDLRAVSDTTPQGGEPASQPPALAGRLGVPDTADDLAADDGTVTVTEHDLNGDGTPDLRTTTITRSEDLRFGPGSPSTGERATEIAIDECDEDNDGVPDWITVTASERISVDLDGDGAVDISSINERVSHDFDADGIPDLITSRVVEEVAVEDASGRRRMVRTEHSRVEEIPAQPDPLTVERDAEGRPVLRTVGEDESPNAGT